MPCFFMETQYWSGHCKGLQLFLFWHLLLVHSVPYLLSCLPLHNLFTVILIHSHHVLRSSQATTLHQFTHSTIYTLCCYTHMKSHTYMISLISPPHPDTPHAPPIEFISIVHIHDSFVTFHVYITDPCDSREDR